MDMLMCVPRFWWLVIILADVGLISIFPDWLLGLLILAYVGATYDLNLGLTPNILSKRNPGPA